MRTRMGTSVLVAAAMLAILLTSAEAEDSQFCAKLKAAIEATAAAEGKSQDVESKLPGADSCQMSKGTYYCLWPALPSQAALAKKSQLAEAIQACLKEYARSDESRASGPVTVFRSGGIQVEVGSTNPARPVAMAAVVITTGEHTE